MDGRAGSAGWANKHPGQEAPRCCLAGWLYLSGAPGAAACPDSAALEQPKRPRRRLSGPEILHGRPVPGHGRFGSS